MLMIRNEYHKQQKLSERSGSLDFIQLWENFCGSCFICFESAEESHCSKGKL